MSSSRSNAALRLVDPQAPSRKPTRVPARAPLIAVVIPAFNEEENIERVLQEIDSLRRARPRWRIVPIVVNDGSSDRTEEVLEKIAADYGARFISLPLNVGIGRAVQTGLKLAVRLRAQVVLQLDGDGQHPAEQIPVIVGPVLSGKTEVAVGSRYVAGAGGNVSTRLRQAGTWFFSRLIKLLVGISVQDVTSGFRAFSGDAAEFLSRCYPDDYPEVQAYVPLARRGFRISEHAVSMRPRTRGISSITPLKSVYYMIKVAFATSIDLIRPLPRRRGGPLER
ncbi:MAG: glycosyltransferase family 2 protein [Oligoflexia bacterium]|nr:glycosyltransferase family 2 protein [Oligoflexia bacterium]